MNSGRALLFWPRRGFRALAKIANLPRSSGGMPGRSRSLDHRRGCRAHPRMREIRASARIREGQAGEGTMTTTDNVANAGTPRPGQTPVDHSGETALARLGLAFTNWAERWFPDAYVFVALAVAVVAAAALLNGASPVSVAKSFGEG